MFIDVDNNKLIHTKAIEMAEIEGLKVIFKDKSGGVLGSIQMKNEDELDDYCEYLRGGYLGRVLGIIEEYQEQIKYNLEDIVKEPSKIKEYM